MERTKLKILKASNYIPSLDEVQKFIKGDVEQVIVNKRYCFIVNDMAATNGMPINEKASKIYSSFHKTKKYIYGNVLLIKIKLLFAVEYFGGMEDLCIMLTGIL